jgi:1-deoxy-D-xylulose-5-phosphate reductoisomerase
MDAHKTISKPNLEMISEIDSHTRKIVYAMLD